MSRLTYRDAGVDIDKFDGLLGGIQAQMRRTFGPRVLPNENGFAGWMKLNPDRIFGRAFREPVLVGCTDGVGTKLKIAFMTGKHDTVGIDLVAMSVNDLLCTGASPLFFLDYVATGKLEEGVFEALVRGVADGCVQADCALLGGETAEMPGFYAPGEYDMAGFAVGCVEKSRRIEGRRSVRPGDAIIGLASSGLHSNGYSLARKAFFEVAGMKPGDTVAEFGRTVGEELLEPTRIYANALCGVFRAYRRKRVPSALAHITGGGLPGNVARVLPPGCRARIRKGAWAVPPVFDAIRRIGDVEEEEMFRVFNMGVGMVVIAPPFYAEAVARKLKRYGEDPSFIGEVVPGEKGVEIVA